MIKGYCFTNLDDYKRQNWPCKFAAVPARGDYVYSESGAVLKVVRISWRFDGSIGVELHR